MRAVCKLEHGQAEDPGLPLGGGGHSPSQQPPTARAPFSRKPSRTFRLPPRPGPPEGSWGTPTNSLPASAREGGGGDRKCQPKASLTGSRPGDPRPSESRAGRLHCSPEPAGLSRAGSEQAPSWGSGSRLHVLGARRAPGPAKQEAQQMRGSVGRGRGQELGRGQEQTGTGGARREEPQGISPRPDQDQARL